jgi:hypothetical protein
MRTQLRSHFWPAMALAIGMMGTVEAQAGKTILTCPATLPTAPAAAEIPEGWSASRRAKEQVSEQKYSTVTFTSGHPDELGFLRPSGETSVDGDVLDDFDLGSLPAQSGVWQICFYEDTPAFIYKKLDTIPARCSVSQKLANAEMAAVCE